MGYSISARENRLATLLQATHSDSDQPEADQRRQANACHTPGWFTMACSYAGGTGGLPPRPGFPRLTRVEQGRLRMNKACQEGAEEIPLRADATWALMPAL